MKVLNTGLLAVVLGVALTSTASAGLVANGSIAFADGVASYTGATLSQATSITLSQSMGSITSATGVPFACTQADCTPTFSSSSLTAPTTFSVPLGAYANFIVWGDGLGGTHDTRYQFTTILSSASSVGQDDLTIFATGTFHDSLGVYDDADASLIFNFTQSGGPGHSISGSGTINTPASFQLAPEPGTMVLFGGALVGLGLIRRKKQA